MLDEKAGDKTLLEHCLAASDFHDTQRPQRNGLFHANTEHHLFDRNTVKGYEHYVAFPNMGDVWGKRQIARLLDHRGEKEKAAELRKKADARARAIIKYLYNTAPGYEGTWKQIHENGDVLQIRHGIDFMHGGVALHEDLAPKQKDQIHQWWHEQILGQTRESDIWVISQDRRDGNNGPHQMEHNGQGAYPGWPYHYAWALHKMGYRDSVMEQLDIIKSITRMGAIGQGYNRDGRRSRSGWVEIAGAFPVPYILNFVFGAEPSGDTLGFSPNPGIKPGATLKGIRWHKGVYEVNHTGKIKRTRQQP